METCTVIEEKKFFRSEALVKAQKKYYEKNKKKITDAQMLYNKEYVKKPFKCECGCNITTASKFLHLRSDRHRVRMESKAAGEIIYIRPCDIKKKCPCGGQFFNRNRFQHAKTQMHKKYMETKQ